MIRITARDGGGGGGADGGEDDGAGGADGDGAFESGGAVAGIGRRVISFRARRAEGGTVAVAKAQA